MPTQMLLPGMENLFSEGMADDERTAYHNVLTSFLEVKGVLRLYPKQLARAGIVAIKVEQLLVDIESLLSLQFERE